jgi:short-subunit dehydrogenase
MTSYVLITGAAGGLGSAFCLTCAKRRFDLVLTDLPGQGDEFARQISGAYGVEVHYYPCDLTSDQARNELFDQLAASGMKFWGLINVAGLDYEGAYAEIQRSQAQRVLKVNLLANMDMTHEILQLRDPARTFRLINVCSMAGYYPMPFKATYAASKRFLLDFSLALREELKGFGTVTALCPGGMPTTEECMRAIFAQGFWGWATTVDPQHVAESTLDYALRGKAVYIPGLVNKLLQWVSALIPTTLKIHFVAARWRKVQAEVASKKLPLASGVKSTNALQLP